MYPGKASHVLKSWGKVPFRTSNTYHGNRQRHFYKIYTPPEDEHIELENTGPPKGRGKSSTPNHHDFRFDSLIFGWVIYPTEKSIYHSYNALPGTKIAPAQMAETSWKNLAPRSTPYIGDGHPTLKGESL